jgi:hypothetical protein
MKKHSYYRDNREISAAEALDSRGGLRDGVTLRVRTQMRDGKTVGAAPTVRLHDGHGGAVGHKPGFVCVDGSDDATVQAQREYRDYLRDAYKQDARKAKAAKPDEDERDEDDDDRDRGDDSAAAIANRRQRVNDAYAAHEQYLRTAYRHGGGR